MREHTTTTRLIAILEPIDGKIAVETRAKGWLKDIFRPRIEWAAERHGLRCLSIQETHASDSDTPKVSSSKGQGNRTGDAREKGKR